MSKQFEHKAKNIQNKRKVLKDGQKMSQTYSKINKTNVNKSQFCRVSKSKQTQKCSKFTVKRQKSHRKITKMKENCQSFLLRSNDKVLTHFLSILIFEEKTKILTQTVSHHTKIKGHKAFGKYLTKWLFFNEQKIFFEPLLTKVFTSHLKLLSSLERARAPKLRPRSAETTHMFLSCSYVKAGSKKTGHLFQLHEFIKY